MRSIRPTSQSGIDGRPIWHRLIGVVDSQDSAAMDRLARAVRCTERYWPAIIAVRTLLFGTVVGWSRLVSQIREPGFVQIYLLQALLDIALITSPHLSSYRRLTPNRKWVLTGPLVAMSGALFTLSVSVAGADHISAAVTLLTPALLMMIMTRSFLLLGIAYGVGSILTLAGQSTFAAQIAAFLCLASMILLNSLLGEPPSNATDDTGLSGEQARAFLIDFEQAKRGWFWQTDRAGKLTYISETLAAQLDHSAHDLIGQPLTALIASTDCDVQSDGGRTLSFHLSARTAFADIAVRAAGAQAERWWAICGQPVTTPYGQFIGFRGSGSDLTEMRRSQAEIARLAQFDSLTGLANRMQMLTTLEQALAHHHGAPGACALLMLDLDRFKEVNDTMGHPAGDSLLRQVAQRLLRLAGTSGKVGRLGGG